MWKYVSRRIRDTFERANHFDKRSTTGFTTSSGVNCTDDKNKRASPPCRWFSSQKCWNSFQNDNDTNSKKWNFDHLNRTWIGAITWSSALVIGWYASQLLHLKHKYHCRGQVKTCPSINTIFTALYPYVNSVKKNNGTLNTLPDIEKVLKEFTPAVHLISNDHNGEKKDASSSGISSTSTSSKSSENDLAEVLNSIENKLGRAAIENGQYQDGLNLLRSAASRNHAPALYNLGLCYEMGFGVTADEKKAMEFYRSAAALEHPVALYNLGIYYGQGRGGLKRDVPTATRLLQLAAVKGQKDAIHALKEFQIDAKAETQRTNEDIWAYIPVPYAQNENILPTQTTLFVENAQLLHMQNCEATVY